MDVRDELARLQIEFECARRRHLSDIAQDHPTAANLNDDQTAGEIRHESTGLQHIVEDKVPGEACQKTCGFVAGSSHSSNRVTR